MNSLTRTRMRAQQIMATFVNEYKEPQKKGYRYEHDEYIHDAHYI